MYALFDVKKIIKMVYVERNTPCLLQVVFDQYDAMGVLSIRHNIAFIA